MIENNQIIAEALEVLRSGGIILYPTDTVWGIGCDATDPKAVAKVFEIKKRADSKALVLLASDLDMVARYVKEVPEMAACLVEVNDKPMTIVYPDALSGDKPVDGVEPKADKYRLAHNTVAEDASVAMRIPMSDFCCSLVRKLGRPLVSTSANISGEATPKTYSEISDAIKASVDYIVDSSLESKATGKSSSIIKVGTDGQIKIIRD